MLSEQEKNIDFYIKEIKKLSSKHVKVGDYLVDFEKNLITAPNGEETLCSEKLLSLLALFLVKDGGVVSRDEAFEIVYKGQHVVESSFRHRIKDLRGIFGDQPPYRYIENIKGKGYFLKADIEEVEKSKVQPLEAKEVLPPRYNYWFAIAIVFILSNVVLIALYFMTRQEVVVNTTVQAPAELVPLTYHKGHEIDLIASPNGQYLIYSHKAKGSPYWNLYLKDHASGQIKQLTRGEFSDMTPRWSTDGQYITFQRRREASCEYFKARFDFENLTVNDLSVIEGCKFTSPGGYALLWKNNNSVLFSSADSLSKPIVIHSKTIGSAQERLIAAPPPDGRGDYFFALSHDEKSLVVLRSRHWFETELWLYRTDTWEGQLVDAFDFALFTVAWSKDDTKLIYRNAANEITEYNLIDRSKKRLLKLSVPFKAPFLLGPDKSEIGVMLGSMFDSDIARISADETIVEDIEYSSFSEASPIVSNDGKHLAWLSNRSGLFQLWYKEANGTPVQVTQLETQKKFESLEFSPDSRRIAGTVDGQWFIVNIDDVQSLQSYGLDTGRVHTLSWVDNETLLFIKVIDSTRVAVLYDVTSGAQHFLNLADIRFARAGLNAGEFYFVKNEQSGVWRHYQGKEERVFETRSIILSQFSWTISNKGIYFVDDENGVGVVRFFDFSNKVLTTTSIKSGYIASNLEADWLYFVKSSEGNFDNYLIKR
ncbi:winged helix-turn-helix domain-containing protein [Pleionea sp. CnH1-48]|uniref:winged helix-turn-helix domain-containing protein n=1 Tax=Pleionea sp. CnH1-48 TaxID=2954494 RepID=UPI002096D99D|nr:winged helix-turn-helix domain-containing protein [Pleionea sp. CnH1-48]MCO7222778.1 winged helix-turn-helix domain-containing protein [Pleionea sp. CnH1-48]